jgi:hypothetical protein
MDDLSPDEIRRRATHEHLTFIANTPGQRSDSDRDLAQIGLYLLKENRKLEIKARLVDRLPFCSDHRDKVAGKPCRECEIEELRCKMRRLEARAEADEDEITEASKEISELLPGIGMEPCTRLETFTYYARLLAKVLVGARLRHDSVLDLLLKAKESDDAGI